MVTLESGESVVHSGPVVWVGPSGPRQGTLSLTHRALIFEGPIPRPMRPGRGWRPGAMAAPGELRIALWRCRGASSESGPRGQVLAVELLRRRLYFRAEDVAGWVRAINEARAHAPPAPPGALEAAAGGVVGASGRARMPRCEYCGHLSPASSTKCESCGAPF